MIPRRRFLAAVVAAPAILHFRGALALDSPIVRLNMSSWAGVAEQATWAALKEDGSVLGTATGDITSLTQDAISYAIGQGLPFHASGRTYGTNGTLPLLCLFGTIKIPPSVCNVMLWDNVAILSRPSDGGPGIVFDSFEDLTFEQRGGQVLYHGDAAAIHFAPISLTPVDNTVACNLAKIKFQAITVQQGAQSSAAVEWDATQGSIWAGQYNFGEVDGVGNCRQPMRVLSPSGQTYFENNQIGGAMVVNGTSAAIQVGMGQTNQANIRHNSWKWGSIQPGNSACDGFNTFGSYDCLEVGVIGSDNMAPGANRGIVWEPGSQWNVAKVGQFVGCAGGNVIPAGTNNRLL